ncbi:probable G-protein coupled receptor 139 [Liolophura sinensis]|uniref:probable G-protein coupled receptor 139 n=1 Tax=Liolophura sinensis TaxID=3198878 RepID=UPI0031591CAC
MEFLDEINATFFREFLLNLSAEERGLLFQSVGLQEGADIQSLFLPEDSLSDYQAYRIHKLLLLYIPPILLIFGTFGNVFSFLTLRQKSMAKISTYFYLSVLSLSDFMVLYFGLLRLWVAELTNFDIRDQSDTLCKLVMFLGYVSSDLSVWLIIAVTVERYIVVAHPLKASTFCTVPKAKKATLAVVLVLVSIHIHFMWSVKLSEDLTASPRCAQSGGFQYFVTVIWPVIDTLIYFVVPFVIISTMNAFIIWQVRKAKSGRVEMQNERIVSVSPNKPNSNCLLEGKKRSRNDKDSCTKITMMLLTISFAFVITTLPMNICMMAASTWNHNDTGDKSKMSKLQLTKTIAELLMYVNHCVNFFLYCATGQKFRQQILRLCCFRHLIGQPVSDHSKHLYCSKRGSNLSPFAYRQTSNESDEPSKCLFESRV